jgi:RNA polymerase sigma-70 factor (ECF subfamily)
MSDQELIRGILARQRAALALLVARYQRKVIMTAYHLTGNMEESEDLSQEIFLEVINNLEKFGQRSSLETWIYRITINRAINQTKKNRRRDFFGKLTRLSALNGQRTEEIKDTDSGAEDYLYNEKRKMMYQSIGRLPEKQRIAFVLSKFEEKSYKEIAAIMNVTLASVESLIHRAATSLKKELAPKFEKLLNEL